MTKTGHRRLIIAAGLAAILSGPLRAQDRTAGPGPPPPASAPGRESTLAIWAIQVGAFADSNNAARLCARLRARGLDPVTYPNLIDGKKLLYLVWVGRFERPQDAIPEIARIDSLTGIRGVLREQMVWRRKN